MSVQVKLQDKKDLDRKGVVHTSQTRPGDNLPTFRAVQLEFSAYIRNPEVNPPPADIEPRRMQVYADLFYNNIKSFLDGAFPVSRRLLGEQRWRELAREFVHQHGSESPYFLQISEEFLTFLHTRSLEGLPKFLLELCHYEWVELALDVAQAEPVTPYDAQGQLLGKVVLNPLVRPLVYHFPVHTIGPEHQPDQAPTDPTYLLVYRNVDLQVRFMESNPMTHRVLALLESGETGQNALLKLAQELSDSGLDIPRDRLQTQGLQMLERLRDKGIVLGEQV